MDQGAEDKYKSVVGVIGGIVFGHWERAMRQSTEIRCDQGLALCPWGPPVPSMYPSIIHKISKINRRSCFE